MIVKQLARFVLIPAGLFLLATEAEANITMQTSSPTACEHIAGHWVGTGTVSAVIIVKINCKYHGEGEISMIDDHTFNMSMALSKESGICPDHESFQLRGTCQNGSITLKTEDADLVGSLNEQGTAADAHGTVVVRIGDKKVNANVDSMHLEKR